MARYAIIDGQYVINVIEYDDVPTNPPPGFENPVTAVQSDIAGPGWTYADGNFIAPAPTPIAVPLSAQAMTALEVTDMVATRCFKAGLAYPADWKSYTAALRNIVNGTDKTSTKLPAQPAYPAGT